MPDASDAMRSQPAIRTKVKWAETQMAGWSKGDQERCVAPRRANISSGSKVRFPDAVKWRQHQPQKLPALLRRSPSFELTSICGFTT
jgi:hypothetical protein